MGADEYVLLGDGTPYLNILLLANYAIADGLKRAFTRFGKWCRKIIDPEPEPTENDLLEFLPGFRDLFAADIL